jgi:threonine/homoserine/homoserine lactone efflux protein
MNLSLELFSRGMIIGLSIAAPIGPIAILCIRRTLTEGKVCGLMSGFGAASADATYAAIAAFGLTAISGFLVSQSLWLHLAGGILLLYLGMRTVLSRTSGLSPTAKDHSIAGAYASTYILTITNPMTILYFLAVFAGLGLSGPAGDWASAGFLVLGVFAGSALWWSGISGGIGLFHAKLTPRAMAWINRFSGLVILGFAIAVLVGAWG